MMSSFKRYDSYKDSGVEWLGEIPSGWGVKKLKFLGNIFAGLSDKKGDDFSKEYDSSKKEFIPFSNICNNVKIDNNQVQYVNIKDNEKQNRLEKNDIIFLMSSETLDDIGKCSIFLHNGEFYLNSFCKGYRLFSEDVYPEYVNYLLQSKSYRVYFSIVGRGFTRINIKQEYINDVFSIIPSKQEQQKIATFLDTKTQQLDKAIKQKEQLIELLKERRQIVINDAVTKGLDKTVSFKDSGVEWIGEVPGSWEVLPGFRIYNENKTKNTGMIEEQVLSLSYGKIVIKPKEKLTGLVPESFETYQIVKPGDIIIRCMDLQNDQTSLRTGIAKNNGIITSAYLNLNVVNDFNSEYLHYYLHVLDITKVLYKFGTGLRQNLSYWDFKRLPVLVPSTQEQEEIVGFIEIQTKKIDKAIDLQQKQIDKLKEYKTTLIDSVVTGKVRVE